MKMDNLPIHVRIYEKEYLDQAKEELEGKCLDYEYI